jgi:hypothetical protein
VKFGFAHLDPDGAHRGHKDVRWFGLNVPTSSGEQLVLLALFVVGVTNGRERKVFLGLWCDVLLKVPSLVLVINKILSTNHIAKCYV